VLTRKYTWKYGLSEWTWELNFNQSIYDYYKALPRPPTRNYSVYVTHPLDDKYTHSFADNIRQAELLGLRWHDIDLDMLSISVSQTLYKRRGVCQFKEPKTGHSRRRVAMTPKLALFLREHRAKRESIYWQLGKPLILDDLVFSSVEGNPLDPSLLSHEFARLAKQAGLENVQFHDLRHTFASLMFLRGAKPKVISEALGHSSVAFTMDVYSHIIEGMQEDAMALLDEVLPAGKNGVF
jgi:integrase